MFRMLLASAFCAVCFTSASVHAGPILFDQDVTPDVIFGDGNGNGGWTVNQMNGVEVGLRAKVRFPTPSNTFNSNGDGTYNHLAGSQGTAALWNYEFSANSNFDGTGLTLAGVDFILSIDTDPSSAVSFFSANIFAAEGGLFTDNEVGDNSTANGDGVPSNDPIYYGPLNVAQNSQNIGWIGFPTSDATWDFQLTAFETGTNNVLASTSMQVIVGQGGAVVPEPSTFALLGIGGLALVGYGWRRKRQQAA